MQATQSYLCILSESAASVLVRLNLSEVSIGLCQKRQHTARLYIGTMRWMDVKDISILNSVMTDADF